MLELWRGQSTLVAPVTMTTLAREHHPGECTLEGTIRSSSKASKPLRFKEKRPKTSARVLLDSESLMDLYSPREVARAAGVPEASVIAAVGRHVRFIPEDEAIRVGRRLRDQVASVPPPTPTASTPRRMFAAIDARRGGRHPLASAAVSGLIHGGFAAIFIVLAGLDLAPRAAALRVEPPPADLMRLVFLNLPGPGGGGGGGGARMPAPPPKAMREGARRLNSPLPARVEPKPIEPVEKPPEPKPVPLKSEQLPVLIAPIVIAPANNRDRIGVLEETTAKSESRGPGQGGSAGTGSGTGLGSGDGAGVGPGSGGGTGGGPHRPGSGIQPPRSAPRSQGRLHGRRTEARTRR